MKEGIEQLRTRLGESDSSVALIECGLGWVGLNALLALLKKDSPGSPGFPGPSGPPGLAPTLEPQSYAAAVRAGMPPRPATAKELCEIKIKSQVLADLLRDSPVTEVLETINKVTKIVTAQASHIRLAGKTMLNMG